MPDVTIHRNPLKVCSEPESLRCRFEVRLRRGSIASPTRPSQDHGQNLHQCGVRPDSTGPVLMKQSAHTEDALGPDLPFNAVPVLDAALSPSWDSVRAWHLYA
ncbi:hypothetical protein WJX77_008771 [Trebouxia sp. C0004]